MHYTIEQAGDFRNHQFAYLALAEKDHVLRVTLNRPDSKNAFNEIVLKELAFAFSYAHYSPHIWAVVLGAEGNVWCAGADLKTFQGHKDAEAKTSIPDPRGEVILGDLFQGLHKPCIARVHAPVFAGGFLMICGCNYVVARKNATFSLPEVKRGIFPFQVLASLLTVMPARKALDLCIMGKTITAEESFQLGIVTHLAEDDRALDETIDTLISQIVSNSPSALRLGLQAYDEMKSIARENQHKFLYQKLMEVLKTEDAREGISAFKEKRIAKWKGI